MSSEIPTRAFVWVWLPGAGEPVVAGALDLRGELVTFVYGRSYLERSDALPLYLPELPLRRGRILPVRDLMRGASGSWPTSGSDDAPTGTPRTT
jgi:serine/threonine-protein kinase HipA